MQKWIVANWKMNGSKALIDIYKHRFSGSSNLITCPPSIYLSTITPLLKGAQNVAPQKSGAYTGEISAAQLQENGVSYCIVGHSERRIYFHETNAIVKQKAQMCVDHEITPIICIGETLQEYQNGLTKKVLQQQINECIPSKKFWIAYEPIWAIGTGKTPSTHEIEDIHAFLADLTSSNTTILYGGSANPTNAHEILALPKVSGALVGGASLDIESLSKLLQIAST